MEHREVNAGRHALAGMVLLAGLGALALVFDLEVVPDSVHHRSDNRRVRHDPRQTHHRQAWLVVTESAVAQYISGMGHVIEGGAGTGATAWEAVQKAAWKAVAKEDGSECFGASLLCSLPDEVVKPDRDKDQTHYASHHLTGRKGSIF